MVKKLLIPICLMLVLIFSAQSFAASPEPTTFKGEALTFSSYTKGADAAFDGNKETGYAGSITVALENRSIIMGTTVRANSPLVNLKIKGSENGVDWIEIFHQKKVTTIAMAGWNGSGSLTDTMCDSMYTYSFKYLRFEIEYGSISEISAFGYETGVHGYISELDTSFGTNGYQSSGSYYKDYERMPYVVNHVIHSPSKGEVVTAKFTNEEQTARYAFLTLKAKGDAPLTEIALMHKDDKNVTRWDGVAIEVSSDGNTWVNIMTIPTDFSSRHSLRDRTVMIVEVPENDSYVYARISSTKSSIGLCIMDLYTKADEPSVPANVLNGWDGDPFISQIAPDEEKETDSKTSDTVATAESSVESVEGTNGCGSAVMLTAFPITAVCAVSALATRKRKKRN